MCYSVNLCSLLTQHALDTREAQMYGSCSEHYTSPNEERVRHTHRINSCARPDNFDFDVFIVLAVVCYSCG